MSPKNKRSNKYSQLRVAADYGAVGLEMGIAVAMGCYGGIWLDEHYGTAPQFTIVGLFVGLAAAGKSVYRVAKRAQRDMASGDVEEKGE